MPAGKTFFSWNTSCSASKAYLLRLPLGVSMMTWTPWRESPSNGERRAGSDKPYFRFTLFAIIPPRYYMISNSCPPRSMLRKISFEFVYGLEQTSVQRLLGDIEAIARNFFRIDPRRKCQRVRVCDDVDQNRAVVSERSFQGFLQISGILDADSPDPHGLGHLCKVRVFDVDAEILVARHSHFEFDHAQGAVVVDHELDGQFILRQREQISHQHREAAIAAHGNDLALWKGHLGADGLGHGVRHGPVIERTNQSSFAA